MSVYAPGVTAVSSTANTTGVTLSGQTSISFTFNTNPEWVTADGTAEVFVQLTTGKLYGSGSTACHVLLQTVFPATGGATATQYTIPLSNFVVGQNCSDATITDVDTALAQPISVIDFQGDGGTAAIKVNGVASNSNLTTAVSGASPAVYPTTVALTGAITFQ
jgi:pyruvate/2-oxoacid:ferredoxin oxidoreductase beta subunit